MAFKQLLTERLFNLSRIVRASVKKCRVCTQLEVGEGKYDPRDVGVFRRYFYSGAVSVAVPNDIHRLFPTGEKLAERVRGMEERSVWIENLMSGKEEERDLTVADVKKIVLLSQLESLKTRLRGIKRNHLSLSEFLQICAKDSSTSDQAIEFAKLMDESGAVIVLGNTVFLRPEQVIKAIQGVIIPHKQKESTLLHQELEQMEEEKTAIDKTAELHARTVLRGGLAYFVVQTAIFMRLTFWELNWDVMEPICFFATSMFCMGSYVFYLRTSKEPSFQEIFQNRFESKQRRLMKQRNFDAERYKELKKACFPDYLASP